MAFDLHMHSDCSSDGVLTPYQLLTLVKAAKMKMFSITDHNTVDACRQLVWNENKHGFGEINFIPAVELSLNINEDEVHVCAYGIDPFGVEMDEITRVYQKNRVVQAKERTDRLVELGFVIDFDRVMDVAGRKTPSGVTFLNVLKEKEENLGKLTDYLTGDKSDSPYTNFYYDYFFKGGKAFVPVMLLDFYEVIDMLRGKAIFSLAHPGIYRSELVDKVLEYDLDAIEAYSSYHSSEQVKQFIGVAEEKGMMLTAGSDFHGDRIKPGIHVGEHGCSNKDIPDKFFDELTKRRLVYYTL